MEEVIALILVLGGFGLLLLYSTFSWGFVVFKLYGWFVLTALPNLPHFNVLQFVGFSLFLNCIIRSSHVRVKKEFEDNSMTYGVVFISPWLTLLLGWIIYGLFW